VVDKRRITSSIFALNLILMKNLLFVLAIVPLLFSCKKTDCQNPTPDNYVSQGNLLVLCIGDSLEYGLEFNVASTSFTNIPVAYFAVSHDNSDIGFEHSASNDTLFQYFFGKILQTSVTPIAPSEFESMQNPITLDPNLIQNLVPNGNFSHQDVWGKINDLDVVHNYRNQFPTSNIGFAKLTLHEYDSELGFALPVKKYFVFLQK